VTPRHRTPPPLRVARAALVLGAITTLTPARAQMRRRFEPTDLELQPPGTIELDAQVGFTKGETAERVALPDFEVSIGLTDSVQLEVDGAYAVEGRDGAHFSPDHSAPDNLWISSKLGLADVRDDATGRAWGIGAQLGPKVPLSPGARGAGYEALVLVGRTLPRVHVVVNLGGFVDPGAVDPRHRATALEGGVDLDLDAAGVWSFVAEVGGQRFFSGERPQAHATAGITWSATPHLDLSVLGLVSLLAGGDRAALLLGFTADVPLLEARAPAAR
jgi:hypothetical protein